MTVVYWLKFLTSDLLISNHMFVCGFRPYQIATKRHAQQHFLRDSAIIVNTGVEERYSLCQRVSEFTVQ